MSLQRKNIQFIALMSGLSFLVLYVLFAYTWVGAIGALVVASTMAMLTFILGVVALGIQLQRTKSAFDSKQKAVNNMDAYQTRTVEIDLPFSRAFDLALEALQSLDDTDIPKTMTGIPSKQTLKFHEQNRVIGRIRAGLRAKTFGIGDVIDFSRIDIQLQGLDDTTTVIQIDSSPTSSLETLDLGRHTHYVNQIALQIRQLAHEQSASHRLSQNKHADDNDLHADDDQLTSQS